MIAAHLAHRATKPDLMISKGPTGRPFAVKDDHLESNYRPVGHRRLDAFDSRADGSGYLNCWPFRLKAPTGFNHGRQPNVAWST